MIAIAFSLPLVILLVAVLWSAHRWRSRHFDRLYRRRRTQAWRKGALPLVVSSTLTDIVKNTRMPRDRIMESVGQFRILTRIPTENDHWNSTNPRFRTSQPMAADNHHVLILPGPELLENREFCFDATTARAEPLTISLLEEMRAIALKIGKTWNIDRSSVGMFFHIWPDRSQNHLHLIVVDLTKTGPRFFRELDRHVPLDAVVRVLTHEMTQ